VLYGKYSGSDIKIKEEAYIIMREEDILTVIEE
jgi:co-chaperonin GroES (HSP10)